MSKKEVIGKCHICGEVTKLSKEHIPPKSAFNQHKATTYGGEQVFSRDELPWDFSGLSGEQHQGGVNWYRLCKSCNNNTGAWYVPAYEDFAKQCFIEIVKQKQPEGKATIKFTGIYPLRIIKEILAMFAACNNSNFLDIHFAIRDLILDRNLVGIDANKYFLGLYINKGTIMKYAGVMVSLDISSGQIRTVSEITTLPFGLILEIDPKDKTQYFDITRMANDYKYDEKIDIEFEIPIYETNTGFINDHRSREEIISHREKQIGN